MKTNAILDEVHRVREEIARECDYDVHKLFARMRQRAEKHKAAGGRAEYPAPRAANVGVLREEPLSTEDTP